MPVEHWHNFWMGGFWIFPVMMVLLILVCIFVLARVFMGRDGQPPCFFDRDKRRGGPEDAPLEIAKRRYARGEITKEEFEEIKRTIG